MYKCKYFNLKELVNKSLLSIGETILWNIFDDRLLISADKIREKYGPCFINSGNLQDCGLRDNNSLTGAKYSAHKVGLALDLHIISIENEASKISNNDERKKYKIKKYNEIRESLLKNSEFNCLSFEKDISWLHIDTYNRLNRNYNP